MAYSERLKQILAQVVTVSGEKAAIRVAGIGGTTSAATINRLRQGIYSERNRQALTELATAFAGEIRSHFGHEIEAAHDAVTDQAAVDWLCGLLYKPRCGSGASASAPPAEAASTAEDRVAFAKALHAATAGMKQTEIAETVGLSQPYVAQMLNGKRTPPRWTALRIIERLGIEGEAATGLLLAAGCASAEEIQAREDARLLAVAVQAARLALADYAELLELLQEARALMPLGTAARGDWLVRASALSARVRETAT